MLHQKHSMQPYKEWGIQVPGWKHPITYSSIVRTKLAVNNKPVCDELGASKHKHIEMGGRQREASNWWKTTAGTILRMKIA
jgi:hypothetical protein